MTFEPTQPCLLCGEAVRVVLDLGATPLANELRTANVPQERFPLRLVQCTECKHLQIDHYVAPERLYGPDYPYTTANLEHMEEYASELQRQFKPKFVVDIGGNDGAFLANMRTKTLVIDPAGGELAVRALFDEEVATDVAREYGRPDVITCNNCLAHNADLGPILRGVKALLAPKGRFVMEVAYALPMLREGLFDLVYHEHVHHWTFATLAARLPKFGLHAIAAEVVPVHGGSLRVTAGHSPSTGLHLGAEVEALAHAIAEFPEKVRTERELAHRLIPPMVTGLLGYPAKACTLLHYWNVGGDFRWTFDDNPKKIGKLDHFGRTIEPVASILERKPECLFVASWNYADEMIARVKALGYKGKFLVPHPMRGVS